MQRNEKCRFDPTLFDSSDGLGPFLSTSLVGISGTTRL